MSAANAKPIAPADADDLESGTSLSSIGKAKKPVDGSKVENLLSALQALNDNSDIVARLDKLDGRLAVVEKKAMPTVEIIVKEQTGTGDIKQVSKDAGTPELAMALKMLAALDPFDRNLWITGPAGSGKGFFSRAIAKHLALPFIGLSCSATTSESKFAGRPTAEGGWTHSGFIEAYRNGYVILIDEIDAASADLLVWLNSAIDGNGQCFRPDHPHGEERVVERHPKTIIVAAANTYGTGGSAVYAGRAPIDAATVNRFLQMELPYSDTLLKAMCPDSILRGHLDAIRKTIDNNVIHKVCGTRDYKRAYCLSQAGLNNSQILNHVLFGWTREQKAKLPGSVKSIIGV